MRGLTIVMTGSLLVLGANALAEDTAAPAGCGHGGRHGGGHGGMWKQFDKDGDGKLSDQERADMKAAWAARRGARKKEMLANFDRDGDGQLSGEEKAQARKSGASEMRKKMFGELDTSGDGKISADEIQAKMEQMRGKCKGHQAFESKLTEEEKAAMKSISEKWITEMVGKFDADGDGQVAEEEVAAGMAAVREQCKKRHAQSEDAKTGAESR
jgi:Ca2+-binding EF-hand superfamily protein